MSIKVEIPLLKWNDVFGWRDRAGDGGVLYDLDNGLVVDSNCLIMPWEWAGNGVIIQFDDDKEATWFVLSYGGELK